MVMRAVRLLLLIPSLQQFLQLCLLNWIYIYLTCSWAQADLDCLKKKQKHKKNHPSLLTVFFGGGLYVYVFLQLWVSEDVIDRRIWTGLDSMVAQHVVFFIFFIFMSHISRVWSLTPGTVCADFHMFSPCQCGLLHTLGVLPNTSMGELETLNSL